MKKFNLLMALVTVLFNLQFSWAQPGFYEVNAGAFYFSPNVGNRIWLNCNVDKRRWFT